MIRLSRCRTLATALVRRGGSSSSSRQAGRCIASTVTHDIFTPRSHHCTPTSKVLLRSLSTTVEADSGPSHVSRPFEKLLAANRGEIATRILRAGTELGCSTVALYSHEGMLLLRCKTIYMYSSNRNACHCS